MLINKSRSFGAAVAVVDTDVGGGGRREHLTLILETRIGLNDGDGEVAGGVRLEVHVPHESIPAPSPETPLQRSAQARTQHPLRSPFQKTPSISQIKRKMLCNSSNHWGVMG